jgi:EpsI family protein
MYKEMPQNQSASPYPANKKYLIVGLLFLITACFVYLNPPRTHIKKEKGRLGAGFREISGWQLVEDRPLDDEIVSSLDLDDYLFRTYINGIRPLSIYVGYYFSANKIGAAHHPFVCLPGQGWALSNSGKQVIQVQDERKSIVNLAEMMAGIGNNKMLVWYWFQSYNRNSSSSLVQKVSLFSLKLRGISEECAFIEISIPLNDEPLLRARESGEHFIRKFYPQFLTYIEGYR